MVAVRRVAAMPGTFAIRAALAMYSLDMLRQERAARRASVRSSTESATPI